MFPDPPKVTSYCGARTGRALVCEVIPRRNGRRSIVATYKSCLTPPQTTWIWPLEVLFSTSISLFKWECVASMEVCFWGHLATYPMHSPPLNRMMVFEGRGAWLLQVGVSPPPPHPLSFQGKTMYCELWL